jgi:hypothetical protein
MAKISTHPIELILATTERWKNSCLIKDGSLFSANNLWTLENVNQFKSFFVDNLIEGNEETFYQKLKTQLSNSSAEVKQLAAEMLYVVLLFPRKITAHRKAKDVRLIWSWSGESLNESLPNLEASFEEGVGSTGMAYNSYRWAELVFFTDWLSSLKSMPTEQRESLLADPWIFGNWLDKTEGADRRQFRHIVLFLLFPNYYETCSSKNQKNQMLSAFQEKVGLGSQLIASDDSEWVKKDKNILLIREQLTSEAGKPINFYLSPYKELWMQPSNAKNELDDLDEESEDDLSTSNDFQDLSQMFLDLQAKAKELELKEIDQEIPFEFQEKIRSACENKYEISFGKYSVKLITIDTKNKLVVPNICFYMAIEGLKLFNATEVFNDAFKEIYQRLKASGKTTVAKSEDFYVEIMKSENANTVRKDFDTTVPIYLKEIGKDSELNLTRFNKFINIKNWRLGGSGRENGGKNPGRTDTPRSAILTAFGVPHELMGSIYSLVEEFGKSGEDFSKFSLLSGSYDSATVDSPKNLIVYGAPGTGKSYYLNNLLKDANTIRTVFHSETQNSDFVGSLKPVTKVIDGVAKVTYEFVAGPFIKAFVAAVSQPNKQIHLIIEEINRANAAAVFGEIFQLLDRDASGRSEYEIQADELLSKYLRDNLDPNFNGLIFMPSNLIINATMNSSDQGVYPLDSAFKRRWSFKYMPIDFQDSSKGAVDLDGRRITWDILAKSINEILSTEYAHLEEDRFIGPWFLNKNEVNSKFSKAIESKLFTYLWSDVLRHQQKDKIFNAQNIATFSDLIKVFNRQLAGDQVDVFSELVHQSFDRHIAEATPVIDEPAVDETDE